MQQKSERNLAFFTLCKARAAWSRRPAPDDVLTMFHVKQNGISDARKLGFYSKKNVSRETFSMQCAISRCAEGADGRYTFLRGYKKFHVKHYPSGLAEWFHVKHTAYWL